MKYDNGIQFIYSIALNIFHILSQNSVHKQLAIEKLNRVICGFQWSRSAIWINIFQNYHAFQAITTL